MNRKGSGPVFFWILVVSFVSGTVESAITGGWLPAIILVLCLLGIVWKQRYFGVNGIN